MNIKELTGSNILESAYSISKEQGIPIFLVGGAVRDLVLSSRLGRDIDFALERDVQKSAKIFAEKVGGSFFSLDRERGHYRVTIKEKAGVINTDFSRFRGDGIGKDLRERDFTINSMAIDLKDLFERHEINIIDPLNGLSDIGKGMIRACSSRVFDDDPLRLLRAVRISRAINFLIEDKTEQLIREKGGLLADSSRERIRDELFLMLYAPPASKSIEKLASLGLLNTVLLDVSSWKGLNQGKHHDYNLFDHAVKTMWFVEAILSNFSGYFPDHASFFLKTHFDEQLESNVTRGNLIKLIAFLHDSGKVETKSYDGEKARFFGHDRAGEEINKAIARRLKLGRKASRVVANVTKHHMRILNISKSSSISRRAKYRFFRGLGADGIDCLILSLADGLATRIHPTSESTTPLLDVIRDFLEYYFEDCLKVERKPLLNGKEIMELLGIPEGRGVGRLLSAIKEAEAEGVISTEEEAKDFVKCSGS